MPLADYLRAVLEAAVRHFETSGRAPANLLAGSLITQGCYGAGDIDRALVSLGPSACFVDRIEPLQAIIDRLMTEAAACHRRPDGMALA